MKDLAQLAFPGSYLIAILLSMTGIVLIDRRLKLALFSAQWRRVLTVVPTGVVVFLIWDLVAITSGVFFRGTSNAYVGLMLAPEIPVEELFFLTFLSYLALVMWLAVDRIVTPSFTSSGRRAATGSRRSGATTDEISLGYRRRSS